MDCNKSLLLVRLPGNHTDSELVAMLNQGDRKAFEIIYNTYVSELYRYARHLIYTKEDCEEIVQDIFERLWVHHKTLKITSLKAYLYGAVRNQILNYFKRTEIKRKYAEHYRVFAVIHEGLHEGEQNAENIHRMLEQGINQMPERVQVAIRLRLSENLSNTEIAQRMNVTNKTVENYMHIVYTYFRESHRTLYNTGQ